MSPLLPSDIPESDYFAEGLPRAKEVLKDEFFWDPGDDLSPIGGDGGAESIEEFWRWRDASPHKSAYNFLQSWLSEIGFSSKELELIANNDFSLAIGSQHSRVNHYDDYVIAIAFSQFMKDGYVDSQVYKIAETALNRQTNVEVIEYRSANPPEATRRLEKICEAFSKMQRK